MFCHVPTDNVFAVHDCSSVYHVPLLLHKQGYLNILETRLKLTKRVTQDAVTLYSRWKTLATRHDRLHDKVQITLVGKYTDLQDSYASVVKSLQHAALACNRKLTIEWVEASDLEQDMLGKDPIKFHESWKRLCGAQGILVPGGFGERGTEGKIAAAKWARENKIPYLGICLGLQVAVIEFARNVCGLEGANSSELDPKTPHPVVLFMPEISKTHMGGTMRLGSRPTMFMEKHKENSVTYKLYGQNDMVHERHRHRYEVNPKYVPQFEEAGLQFVGQDEKGERMEIFELKDHPFYIGTQYHPEYKTRPLRPSPPFLGFIMASAGMLEEYLRLKESDPSKQFFSYDDGNHSGSSSVSTPSTTPRSASMDNLNDEVKQKLKVGGTPNGKAAVKNVGK